MAYADRFLGVLEKFGQRKMKNHDKLMLDDVHEKYVYEHGKYGYKWKYPGMDFIINLEHFLNDQWEFIEIGKNMWEFHA